MKKLIFIILISIPLMCCAQFVQTGIGGKYFYSSRWDKMIQTYNFSRPHLNQKQPLLQYGGMLSLTCWSRNSGKLNHGFHSDLMFATSYAENPLLNNRINVMLVTAGYGLHIPASQLMNNTYLDLFLNAEGSLVTRRVNGEALIVDDKRTAAPGVGCNIQFRYGYEMPLTETIKLTPYAGGSFSPFHYSPKSESVINQTMGLFEESGSTFWSVQIGIGIQFRPQKPITP